MLTFNCPCTSIFHCPRGFGLAIAVVLLLAFVERPSSLSISSDPRRHSPHWDPPCGVTESIELVCLIIFSLDLAVKVNATSKIFISCYLFGLGFQDGYSHMLLPNPYLFIWITLSLLSVLSYFLRATWLAGRNSERTNGWFVTQWSFQCLSLIGFCLSAWCVTR